MGPLTSLLFSGAAEKPYTVEDAVSYNELDYFSVSYLLIRLLFIDLFLTDLPFIYEANLPEFDNN